MMSEAELAKVQVGDRVVIEDGTRRWTNTVKRITRNLIHTDGRTYHRRSGLAQQYSFGLARIVGFIPSAED
jgi:hypothetical protein